jgi:hypothetical protein
MGKKVLLSFFLLLSGCGNVYNIQVPHLFMANHEQLERHEAMSRVYLRIEKPPMNDVTSSFQLVNKGVKNIVDKSAPFSLNAAFFSSRLQKQVSYFGGNIYASRVVIKMSDPDPYLHDIQPTSILNVQLSNFEVTSREEKKKVTVKIDQNKSEVREIPFWIVTGKYSCRYHVETVVTKQVLFDGTFTSELEKQIDEQDDLDDDILFAMGGQLLEKTASSLAPLISPAAPVICSRPLYKIKDQEDSLHAYRLATKGQWNEAETIWKTRLASDHGSWKDKLNLAISAEVRRDYKQAKQLYLEAEPEVPIPMPQKLRGEPSKMIWTGRTSELPRRLFKELRGLIVVWLFFLFPMKSSVWMVQILFA